MTRRPEAAGLRLPLRYLRFAPDGRAPFTEAVFRHVEKWDTFAPAEVALVLVDVWNLGWGPRPLLPDLPLETELCAEAGATFGARVRRITQERIVPALAAARRRRLAVAHINLPDVLRRYPQWGRCTMDADAAAPAAPPAPPPPAGDWPPAEWVQAWRGAKAGESLDAAWERRAGRVAAVLDIPEPCRPVGDELLVASAEQFHRLLRVRRVRVLVYAGFWADACLVNKAGAMRDMSTRGYLCIALRDATTTREHAETVEGEWATHAAIDRIEQHIGYTTSTAAFIRACGS